MTFVNITALTYPAGAEEEIERRFAARRKAVDAAPGFLEFELLRPAFGQDRYFVVTRWNSREEYDVWSAARPSGNHAEDERRGMSVEVLGFEVVQHDE
ncbi:MAG: antibiotic biosynthesis monooxygenase [Propioniciclava sp.]|uniref:antibiotic biosynthesis monooxygenase family protein n=1 Tax=Propioniciclava sp. TaxID=2038686 RepID=UPI0039E4622A